jgi:L-lactate dehydrogenase complex protein LldE
MKISIFIPCFINQFYPQVGSQMVELLERLGHTIDYPEGQTCCGQPAFNSGYWDESRAAAEKMLEAFADAEVVVSPSGSCGAMFKVFYNDLFKDTPQQKAAKALSDRTWELSDFLVNKLGVTDVGARFDAKITFHDGCHSLRELGIHDAPRLLLANVKGLELIEMKYPICCGFGGTFAVKYPEISAAMAEVKTDLIRETGADYVVSNDSSCLMHIQGYMDRRKINVRSLHLIEVLSKQ